MRRRGYTQQEIADVIGVVQSALSYELNKNKRSGKRYDATYANHRAYVKRKYGKKQGRRIALNKELRKTVEDYLIDDQSPEHVAERIKRYHKDAPVNSV